MRPVVVAKHLSRFKKLAAVKHPLKRLPAHKMILFALLLLASRETRGIGDAEHEARHGRHQAIHKRGLAAAGGGRNDENGRHEGGNIGIATIPDSDSAPGSCRSHSWPTAPGP